MINSDFWRGRRVLLTGHTGFKGSWTSMLLNSMGAEVHGLSLAPGDSRGLFVAAGLAGDVIHNIGDIRDLATVRSVVEATSPEVVIHMAAQSLVRPSYTHPVETYSTNVMGTVHLLDALRHETALRAVVVVTSDKCYENVGSIWGYRETDEMGGHDPYSNSKGCAELVTSAYRRSYFSTNGKAQIASARAGNVIGGGDWSVDRLIPDAVRAFTAGNPLSIRNPNAVRPWQHVLEPALGYLTLAEKLALGENNYAEGWNFGPSATSEVPVRHVVEALVRLWGEAARWEQDGEEHVHEAAYLKLDCTKANARLGWRPLLSLEQALALTVEWYAAFRDGQDMRVFTHTQIRSFVDLAAASYKN